MHDTAYKIGGTVMETYLPTTPSRILEIGSQNVNGTLRDHAPRNAEYVGLDFEKGDGVDIVITGLEDWSVPDSHFDLVMASSVFEHDKAFWATFLGMCSKVKAGGHLYLSAPSNGTVHRYPRDCWRFYPDSGLALEDWGRSNGFEITLIESFTAEREREVWNDFCAIFRIGPRDAELNRDFVYSKVRSTNVITWRSSVVINPADDTEDTRLLLTSREEAHRWVLHADHLNSNHAAELATREGRISELQQYVEELSATHAADNEGHTKLIAELESRAASLVSLRHSETDLAAEQIASLLHQVEVQRNRLSVADEAISSRDETIASKDKQISDKDETIADYRKELAECRTGEERMLMEIGKIKADMLDRIKNEEIKYSVLEDEVSRLREKIALRESEATQAWESADAEARERKRLRADLSNATNSLSEVSAELERNRARVKELVSDLSKNQSQLEERWDEVAALGDLVAEEQDRAADYETQNKWLREACCFLLERGKWWWRFMPSDWQNEKRDRRLRFRKLFDSEVYMRRNPDVSASGQDAFRHYVHHGIAENRRYN